MSNKRSLGARFCVILAITALFFMTVGLQAQETTGGLQGTVKDASGAVVSKATVELTGTALLGVKKLETDAGGYYRFANLPPGVYAVSVTATGFTSLKRGGVTIEVGHLPSLDLTLKVGSEATVVEVTGEAPLIDVTTTRTLTNITEAIIAEIPHGRSFQSVIQFAPAARNEPLAGNNIQGNGTGGMSPGSGSNGQAFGYSVAGGADSENSYLVEGQETANIIGGFSHTSVPFEFIQEVQIKSSGVEAEHGGSLGGVVNVILKKGSNAWHGVASSSYESDFFDGSANARLRYDSSSLGSKLQRLDPVAQSYQGKKDHYKTIQPSVTIGGPIMKDRLWVFLGFAPEYSSQVRNVNWSDSIGTQAFTRDSQTYYSNGRLDAVLTQKIRVFGSWLYNYQRRSGAVLPYADSVQGFLNPSIGDPITNYSHSIGFVAPSATYNVGADITLTPRLISTTRYGYYFENYHDIGYPTSNALQDYQVTSVGALASDGTPLPAALQQTIGTTSAAYNQFFTFKNAMKHSQFDQDLAFFKSGWLGTHNFKFGYQLNHLYNDISQPGNLPDVQITAGSEQSYTPQSNLGEANCATTPNPANCAGKYGYIVVNDYGTVGQASNYNHGLFAQDAWTVGKGLTLNLGIRVDKEYLPAYPNTGLPARPINFGWGDKIAPRLGAAWDVFQNGKLKVFGSYGVFNDTMKLNLAISSFGGQYWRECAYALSNPDPTALNAVFKDGRACPSGPVSTQANWANGVTPDGLTFIENLDARGTTPAVSNIKPYRQHESVFGVDYQLAKNVAFEARWDRRRLDHAIEDASIFNPAIGSETFVNINPGEGVDKTFNGFSQFLYGGTGPVCNDCPVMPKAARSYDGLELRLNKGMSHGWAGMFSYTYSKLRGNYSGLTSTDISDGNGGRNAPNNSRAFDEPYFQFDAHGKSANGPLGTDRPNTFKGYVDYRLPWNHNNATTIGLFQTAYQGTPRSTFLDVGYASTTPWAPTYVEGRGKYVDVTRAIDGSIIVNSIGEKRTPWYSQSDLNLSHQIRVNKGDEPKNLGFEMTVANLWNQHSVTSYWDGLDSENFPRGLAPGNTRIMNAGAQSNFMHPYDWQKLLNTNAYVVGGVLTPEPIVLNSQYGKPLTNQLSRTVRFKVSFTF